jgi:AcrR family transcriptional regulator
MSKKPVSTRSRTNDPAGVRKRILDATADAFQKHGYHSTSTHDIVRAAGVTAGALHHHFPTKKVLALNVIQERVAQAVDKHWLEPVRSARGAEEGIRTAFEQIASALDRSRTILGCPLNNLALELCAADSEFREAIESIYDNWRKVIADKLRADSPALSTPRPWPPSSLRLIQALSPRPRQSKARLLFGRAPRNWRFTFAQGKCRRRKPPALQGRSEIFGSGSDT